MKRTRSKNQNKNKNFSFSYKNTASSSLNDEAKRAYSELVRTDGVRNWSSSRMDQDPPNLYQYL